MCKSSSITTTGRAIVCWEAVAQLSQEQSTAGVAGASVLWQMLQHVVNHSTYHRGQVTIMLRKLEVTPPKSMDLIAFYRERT